MNKRIGDRRIAKFKLLLQKSPFNKKSIIEALRKWIV
jgi:hypothetical protein